MFHKLVPFSRELKKPLELTSGPLTSRSGYYGQTKNGWGEISPFPGLPARYWSMAFDQARFDYPSTKLSSHQLAIFNPQKSYEGHWKLKFSPKNINWDEILDTLATAKGQFRLDFNERCSHKLWSQLPDTLDYVEDPFVFQSRSDIIKALESSKAPLAIDTNLIHLYQDILDLPFVAIIKPRLWGSMDCLEKAINTLKQHGKRCILSNIFDSPWSRSWYEALGNYFDLKDEVHGVDFDALFVDKQECFWPFAPQ